MRMKFCTADCCSVRHSWCNRFPTRASAFLLKPAVESFCWNVWSRCVLFSIWKSSLSSRLAFLGKEWLCALKLQRQACEQSCLSHNMGSLALMPKREQYLGLLLRKWLPCHAIQHFLTKMMGIAGVRALSTSFFFCCHILIYRSSFLRWNFSFANAQGTGKETAPLNIEHCMLWLPLRCQKWTLVGECSAKRSKCFGQWWLHLVCTLSYGSIPVQASSSYLAHISSRTRCFPFPWIEC